MKIIGVGVDIVDNKRIKKLLKNTKFIKRKFGKNEVLYSKKKKDKISYFSKRCAAKESLSKALGTGFSNGLNFKDIQILNDQFGKPYFLLGKKVKILICKKKK